MSGWLVPLSKSRMAESLDSLCCWWSFRQDGPCSYCIYWGIVLFSPLSLAKEKEMGVLSNSREWDLDLDRYLNRILPPSPLHKLPTPVSRFLGYRRTQRQDVGNVLGAFWSMVGAFCGLAVIAAVFSNMDSIEMHHPPALIASFLCIKLLVRYGACC
jgi:hypothetical protein